MVIGFASCQKAVSATASQLAHVPKGSTYGLSCFLSLPLLYYSRHAGESSFSRQVSQLSLITAVRATPAHGAKDLAITWRIDFMTMIHDRLNK